MKIVCIECDAVQGFGPVELSAEPCEECKKRAAKQEIAIQKAAAKKELRFEEVPVVGLDEIEF